jgi:hypothetical protein
MILKLNCSNANNAQKWMQAKLPTEMKVVEHHVSHDRTKSVTEENSEFRENRSTKFPKNLLRNKAKNFRR